MKHVGYEAETGTVLAVGAESYDLSHLGELGIKVNTNLEARFSHQYKVSSCIVFLVCYVLVSIGHYYSLAASYC